MWKMIKHTDWRILINGGWIQTKDGWVYMQRHTQVCSNTPELYSFWLQKEGALGKALVNDCTVSLG